MSGKITFFIFGKSGAPVKQLSVSRAFLFFLGFFAVSFTAAAGFGVYDYYHLKMASFDAQDIESNIKSHLDEIVHQRKQIQTFADEINSLKSELVALNNFENQIRIIAGIDNSDKQKGLLGIGGSIPEDLNPKIDLKEKHNSLMREMHDQVKQLHLVSSVQEQGFETLMKHLVDQGNLLAHTPAIRPTKGIVTSRFGSRRSPFTGRSEFHEGLDIANRHGTSVVASADGVVTYAAPKGFWGNMILINHGHGMVTRYAHLSKILKKSGDRIKRGDIIGKIGTTGRSTGPHLHYEVHLNGIPVNPEKYILN
ncbi:M23 family metallopeptidase [Desulfonema magnum]|uniref:Peptidase M23 domain-containing protein n=1 Tax=Desulfonema magnum TaxID=45655 RepID=A0A975GND4_9BACT|nr:M23 family metallopeptidase [Desulfonema magnum]QTA86773.1 Peptidase M23 domain-containing protein [Desulfonema magnum]